MGVTSISNRGGLRSSMPSNGVKLDQTGADDKCEDRELQLGGRRESDKENADGSGSTKAIMEGTAGFPLWSAVSSVASCLGWHRRPLLWLIIAIVAARAVSLWMNHVSCLCAADWLVAHQCVLYIGFSSESKFHARAVPWFLLNVASVTLPVIEESVTTRLMFHLQPADSSTNCQIRSGSRHPTPLL